MWFHARLAIGQCGQLFVILLFIFLWWAGMNTAVNFSEAKRDEIEEAGGLGAQWGLYFVPEAWM